MGGGVVKFFCDTSVLVAGSVHTHPQFVRANPVLIMAAQNPNDFYCSLHSLAEAYSALTQMPVLPRIQPATALEIILDCIIPCFQIVTLDTDAYLRVIANCVEDGLTGAMIYDALIMHCAATVKADRIYTFNVRHFQRALPTLASKVIAP